MSTKQTYTVQMLELVSTTYTVAARSVAEAETAVEGLHHDDEGSREQLGLAEIVFWQISAQEVQS